MSKKNKKAEKKMEKETKAKVEKAEAKKEKAKSKELTKAERSKMAKASHVDQPVHPKCPTCGKAMYKWMGTNEDIQKAAMKKLGLKEPVASKPSKKSDPWAYCRNVDCALFAQNQAESASDPTPEVEDRNAEAEATDDGSEDGDDEEAEDDIERPSEMVLEEVEDDGEEELDSADEEHPEVKKCRRRIAEALGSGDGCVLETVVVEKGGKKEERTNTVIHNAVSIALTVLFEETGDKKLVNKMIDEFDLTDRLGIDKSK